MKTYRQIRQSLTEVGADREEDQNFKLGPDKMSPTPSDEDEYDELDDDIEDTHQEVDAIRPVYVRDKLGHYTHAGGLISSSGTMAQMIQQTATKNLQSEYVPEDGEALDEEETIDELSKKTLGRYTKASAADLGNLERMNGLDIHRSRLSGRLSSATQDADNKHRRREIKNRKVGIGRAVNRLAKEETKGYPETPRQKKEREAWKKSHPANEEVDFVIDELSKKTLGRYTKRAAHDLDINAKVHGYKTGLRKAGRGPQEPSPLGGMKPAGPDDHERKLSRTRKNRRVGIGRAVNRLAKSEEYALEENAMDSLKKIVSRQTAETIRLADGSRLQVDMTTANALLGVHGALNIHNQKKMADTLNSNKAGFAKMAKFAFKQFGSRPGKVGTPNTGVREAYVSQEAGITAREKAGTFQGMRVKKDEYTPDHGETFAETENVVPGGRYTKAERKAAADRARAARFKRDVARMTKDHRKVDPAPPQKPNSAQRAGRKEEYVGEASDEKEYDNHPWTKGDLSPKQVRAKLDLVKKIAKERARKRLGGGSPDVEYDDKIGRG